MTTTNYVYFDSTCITKIVYVPNSLYSNHSKNGGDPGIIYSNGTWTISIDCDRSNDPSVAARLNNEIPSANNLWGSYSNSARPQQLNFCFQVIMTFATPSGPFSAALMLGQGNTSTTNDWWIGGEVVCNGQNSVGAVQMVCLDSESGTLLQVLDLESAGVEYYQVTAWFTGSESDYGETLALSSSNSTESHVDASLSTSSNSISLSGSYIVDMTYIPGTLVCSTPAADPTILQSGSTWTATLSCERSGSSQVASQFVSAVGSSNNMYGASTSATSPGNMNFFFGLAVTFSFGGVTYAAEVYVGQGHFTSFGSSINNWWIGSTALGRCGASALLAVAEPNQAVAQAFQVVASSAWQFQLSPFWNNYTPLSQPAWMARLNPDMLDLLITNINLPGTHDSGSIGGWTRLWTTQDSSLTEQFYEGARVFDIRIAVRSNGDGSFCFYCCHGDFLSNKNQNLFQTLQSALSELQDVLTAYPSEFIVMVVKVDDDGGLTNYLPDLNNLFEVLPLYDVSQGVPTVREMLGKIFPLSRKAGLLPNAISLSYNNNPWYVTSLSGANSVCVQDQYVDFQGNAEPAKLAIYKNAALNAESPARQSGDALMNYGSATDGPNDWFVMGGLNEDILSWLGSFSQADRPAQLGWTLHDFFDQTFGTDLYAEASVPQLVVDSNFGYSMYPLAFTLPEQTEASSQAHGLRSWAQRVAAHAFYTATRNREASVVVSVPAKAVAAGHVDAFIGALEQLQGQDQSVKVVEVRVPIGRRVAAAAQRIQPRFDELLTDRIEVQFVKL
jgi:hypothetical protein